jgi:hypothetical protein
MADGGIGEAALLDAALEGAATGAAVGGGVSALTGGDPFKGALMGGLTGGVFGGAGNYFNVPAGVDAFTAETSTGLPTVAADAGSTQALTGLQTPPTYDPSTNILDYGNPSPYAGASTNGIVGAQGGQNVLQNQLGATVGGAPVNPMYTDMPATGIGGAGSAPLMSTPTAAATGVGATPAATSGGGISGLIDKGADLVSEYPKTTAGILGAAYLMDKERNRYGVPAAEKYNGPLSKFSYNPMTYQPDVVKPPSPLYHAQYAAGGPVEMMSNNAAIGANTMYPMANMTTSAFATPYQTPQSTNMMQNMAPSGGGTVDAMSGEPNMQGTHLAKGGVARLAGGGIFGDISNTVGDALAGVGQFVENVGQGRIGLNRVDHGGGYQEDYSKNSYTYDPNKYKTYTAPTPDTYQAQYARGGIASLGSYSDGGRMLKGPGDGMSDSIPARIGAKQEARLADGEFVVPADVVSHLGNGSTDAGAKQLYAMMDKVRQARTGRKAQGRQIKPNKYMPA